MLCRFPMNPNSAHGYHAARPPRALISNKTLHIPNDALFTPRATPATQKHPASHWKPLASNQNILLLIDSRALGL